MDSYFFSKYKEKHLNNTFYSFELSEKYDEILKIWYGDYMKMPPAEKRIPHNLDKIYRLKDGVQLY